MRLATEIGYGTIEMIHVKPNSLWRFELLIVLSFYILFVREFYREPRFMCLAPPGDKNRFHINGICANGKKCQPEKMPMEKMPTKKCQRKKCKQKKCQRFCKFVLIYPKYSFFPLTNSTHLLKLFMCTWDKV